MEGEKKTVQKFFLPGDSRSNRAGFVHVNIRPFYHNAAIFMGDMNDEV